MRNKYLWIFFLIWPLVLVRSRPADNLHDPSSSDHNERSSVPIHYDTSSSEQVISVRITSSVAVGRTQIKPKNYDRKYRFNKPPLLATPQSDNSVERLLAKNLPETLSSDIINVVPSNNTAILINVEDESEKNKEINNSETASVGPPTTQIIESELTTGTATTIIDEVSDISGPNIDFLKQLDAKKGKLNKDVETQYDHFYDDNYKNNYTEDSIAEPSVKEILQVSDDIDKDDIADIPLARSIPFSGSKNHISKTPIVHKTISDNIRNSKLTTVSFDVVHDTSSAPTIKDSSGTFSSNSQVLPQLPRVLKPSIPQFPKIYNEPAKIYSQPAKIYSEPAKFYSEPAKVYSEPAKIYSEPAKVYSEPAKIYSEPAKFYSEPASLHLPPGVSNAPWQSPSQGFPFSSTIVTSPAPFSSTTLTKEVRQNEAQVEKNYEVDEKLSVLTDGRSHGVQTDEDKGSNKEKCKQDNCKVGYVVEGRQYKKYQVEEKTPDGFIVGEYGVVRNEDGALRGVRYTADSDVSPRLIYDTLMKFLQLK